MNLGHLRCLASWALFCFSATVYAGNPPTGTAPATEPLEGIASQPTEPKIDPEAARILRQVSDTLVKSRSFRVQLHSTLRIRAEGMNTDLETLQDLAVQRPNKCAYITQKGHMGITIVCDGKNVYQYMPMLNKYTIADSPEELDGLPGGFSRLGIMGADMMIGSLLKRDPYEDITEGVHTVTLEGKQEVDKVLCHHIKATQADIDWEMWVDQDKSLIRKIVPDMSKTFSKMSEESSAFMKDMRMEITLSLKDWEINPPLPDDIFTFQPPEGAEKVDSFFEGFEQEPYSLLGQEAPPVKLDLLDGNQLDLAAHKGKHVVILDFWATWCGPCIETLPTMAEIARDYKDKGVVVYAVNREEDPQVIQDFLKRKKITIPVALDRDGKISESYEIEGIPHTVIIGKDGIIQAAHVGAMPNLKKQLTEEINAVLADKNLAQNRQTERDAPNAHEGMTVAWTCAGRWAAVAADPVTKRIYAIDGRGNCMELDAEGKRQREFQLDKPATCLRLANLLGDPEKELLTFSAWGPSVTAYDTQGQKLWDYPGGQGIDDVWAADINGSGMENVIIGYNGMTGLHLLDNRGLALWKYTRIGNVWHVCAGNVRGNDMSEIAATSARGRVHVFDSQGELIKEIDPGCYANMIRINQHASEGKGRTILVGGQAENNKTVLVAIDFEGHRLWSLEIPHNDGEHFHSAETSASQPWLAAGMKGGVVLIVDTLKGKINARLAKQGTTPEVAWMDRNEKSGPLLLVATGRGLTAYEITETTASESKPAP